VTVHFSHALVSPVYLGVRESVSVCVCVCAGLDGNESSDFTEPAGSTLYVAIGPTTYMAADTTRVDKAAIR